MRELGKGAWGKESENEPLYESPHGHRLLSDATATVRQGTSISDVPTSSRDRCVLLGGLGCRGWSTVLELGES